MSNMNFKLHRAEKIFKNYLKEKFSENKNKIKADRRFITKFSSGAGMEIDFFVSGKCLFIHNTLKFKLKKIYKQTAHIELNKDGSIDEQVMKEVFKNLLQKLNEKAKEYILAFTEFENNIEE